MKTKLSLLALLLAVVMMAMPAFAAAATEATEATAAEAEAAETTEEAAAETTDATEAEAAETPEGSPEITADTPADAETTAVTTSAALPAADAAPAVNTQAKALYERAMAKMEKITSIETQGSMQMKMTAGEEELDTLVGVASRQIMKDGKTEMEMGLYDTTLGMRSTAYYKDGYFYQSIDGMKVKTAMNLDEFAAVSNNVNKELTDDMFAGATMETLENGNTKINCVIGADLLNNAASGVVESMLAGMEISEEVGVEYSDILYSMEFDAKDALVSYRMDFSADITVGEETVTATYAAVMKVKNVNRLLTILFPDSLSSYTEAA